MIYYQTFLEWEYFKHGKYGLKSNDLILSYTNYELIKCERILYWYGYAKYALRDITDEVIVWLNLTEIKLPFNEEDELLFRLTFE